MIPLSPYRSTRLEGTISLEARKMGKRGCLISTNEQEKTMTAARGGKAGPSKSRDAGAA